MRLYYFKSREGNFGDDINAWMWRDLLPEVYDDSPDIWMSGIGTIIGEEMPPAKTKVVFSSGAGYSRPPEGFGKEGWKIVSVRGPLSAKVLGLSQNMAVTDGAILLATFSQCSPVPVSERSGVVFMPHHKALTYGVWQEVCRRAGVEFIDPRDDSHKTLQRLRKAKLVVADAMHAAIVADTLRVPWIPVVASSEINGFKWLDWTLSMEVPYLPVRMPSSSLAELVTRWALNWGGGLHASGQSEQAALDSFHNKLKKKGSWRDYLDKKTRMGLAKALRKIVALLNKSSLGRKLENYLINQAVTSLQKVSQGQTYLSSDIIFSARLSEMKQRLEEIKKIETDGKS